MSLRRELLFLISLSFGLFIFCGERELTPQEIFGSDSFYTEALRYEKFGNLDSARVLCENALRINPKHYDAQRKLAAIYFVTQDYPKAEGTYRSCVELKPDDFWTQYNLGVALLYQGKFSEAALAIRKAIEIDSTRIFAFIHLTDALIGKGDVVNAEIEIRKAMSIEPQNVDFRLHHAWILFVKQDFDRMEEEVDNVLLSNPDITFAHYLRAIIWLVRNKLDRAEVEFKKAIELEPNLPQLHALLGGVKLKTGTLGEAEEELKRALELGDTHPSTYNNLATLYERQGRTQEAEETYVKAIELSSDDPAPYNNLAFLLFYKGELDSSSVVFSKALTLAKEGEAPSIKDIAEDFTKVLLIKGWENCILGDLDEATLEIDSAISVLNNYEVRSRGSEKILKVNANTLRGIVYLKQRKPGQATEKFAKALENDPRDTVARYNLALAYLMAGRFDNAELAASAAIYLAGEKGYPEGESLLTYIKKKREERNAGFRFHWIQLGALVLVVGWLAASMCVFFHKKIGKTKKGQEFRRRWAYTFMLIWIALAFIFFIFPYTKIVTFPTGGQVELDQDRIRLPQEISPDFSRIAQPQIMTFPEEPKFQIDMVLDLRSYAPQSP